ncbi:MAG: hypothetical protein AAB383_02545 [Patescibacteria group bacterium]
MGVVSKSGVAESFKRHEPDDEEVLRAIRDPHSAAYWRALEPHASTSLFEEQLRAALLDGGFNRVDTSQLTRKICQDPIFQASGLGKDFPAEVVPFTSAGNPGFFAVHCSSVVDRLNLEFGFLTQMGASNYFRQFFDDSGAFTNVRDPHRSWPACNTHPDAKRPTTGFLFWRRP